MSNDSFPMVKQDSRECLAIIKDESADALPGEEYFLYPMQDFIIGGDHECDVVIQHSKVSKYHLRFYSVSPGSNDPIEFPALVYCEDLSSNVAYVNGSPIRGIKQERASHLLCHGDIIEIKPYWKFRFHQTNPKAVKVSMQELEDLKNMKDKYEILDQQLGCGSFGSVYLAREASSGDQVACKIVTLNSDTRKLANKPFNSASAKVAVELIVREEKMAMMPEIKILAGISHPNIINLRKAFRAESSIYVFTDLATTGDLYSYTESRGGCLDEYQSRLITWQLTRAVQFLHSSLIVHRDIKPENVLVTDTDFGVRVMLSDFGNATRLETITSKMKSPMGTPGFIAPEAETSKERRKGYTKAVDLWSLGVLTSCLFTGTLPFPARKPSERSEITAQFLKGGDQYDRAGWGSIPPKALKFVRRLLDVDPEKRMTADEALEHAWFTKPPRRAAALKEAIKKITRTWKPRTKNDQIGIITNLPSYVSIRSPIRESAAVKSNKEAPDASSSPSFGPDQNSVPSMQLKRKRTLDDLNETDTQFVPSKDPDMNSVAKAGKLRSQSESRIISVKRTGLFGTSRKTKSTSCLGPDFKKEGPNMLEASPADVSDPPNAKRVKSV